MAARKKPTKPDLNMPEHVDPMLCTLAKAPLQSSEYLYELKWDGYRIISIVQGGAVRMNSRSGLDYTQKYPLIKEALAALGHDIIIDGEVVVFNLEGKPDFDTLQLYNGKRTPIRYCVFDLLYLDGNNLMELPLYQRKELLEKLTAGSEIFLFSESFEDGDALYQKVLEDNLEGIVAKKRDSAYLPGARGYDWLKIPTRKRQEFVIGGWAESDKPRSFKSLLFGAYENGRLHWIGRSGGGYKQAEMPGILAQLKEMEVDKSPFVNKILDTKGAKIHYVKPTLVANFEFATWTKSGRIRKPATFLGFRKDKNAKDVVREVPRETEVIQQAIDAEADPQPPLQKELEETSGSNGSDSSKTELARYHQKRKFDLTPEPEGGSPDSEKLIFVVQKHNASHLHYDFRLEIREVLKSWAVPKGPSMNPEDHRLAMEVEDHPYDYKDFEGIIPQGQYGGGTVMVWDQGTYQPAEPIEGKKQQEHHLLSGYYKNKLNIILDGQKLKGKFNLVRTFGKADNAWLLTKVKDGLEEEADITKKDQSVISGYTLLEIAMDNNSRVWQSNRKETDITASKKDQGEVELDAEIGGADVLNDPKKNQADHPGIKHQFVGELFQTGRPKKESQQISNWKKLFDERVKSEGRITVEGQNLQLTNIEKKLWKTVNKADLIAYYNRVSPFLLPYLKDRPLSLHLKNISAGAPGFYIKDMEGFQPDFMEVFPVKRKHKAAGKAELINYAVCNNLPALIWLINLGCIDLNPWNSSTARPDEPDYIAIDLDPSDDDFKKVIKTARAAKDYLDEKGLTGFIKTSGKTGMHIFIPCKGFNYAKSRDLAEHICAAIHKRVPMFTTLEVSTEKRGKKLFIDFSQNDPADTLAAAYCVRPGKMPLVSTPIHWDELQNDLSPSDFTRENILERIAEKGEIWKDLFKPSIRSANSKVLSKLLT